MNSGSTPEAERWQALIDGFQTFGGTAKNVIQRQGAYGLGLFPIDPSEPVEIRAPEHLLVASTNVDLCNGKIVIKDPSGYPEGYCEWYEQFQADFSWGADAKRTIYEFETNLKSLPPEIIQLLNQFNPTDISNRFPQVEEERELFRRFISTRQINRNGRPVLMPIIELVNHSPQHESFRMNKKDINIPNEPDRVFGSYMMTHAQAAVGVGGGAYTAVALHRGVTLNLSLQMTTGFGLNVGLSTLKIENADAE